jgi:hypothetical protein
MASYGVLGNQQRIAIFQHTVAAEDAYRIGIQEDITHCRQIEETITGIGHGQATNDKK